MFNIKNYEDVPGMILTPQCEDIIKIAKQLPENSTVIEIGCAWGKSTWCWIEGLPKGSTLITIDVFMLDEKKGKHKNRQQTVGNPVINTIMEYWMQHTGYETVLKVLEEHPRKELVNHTIYHGSSSNFDLSKIKKLDCVYIDGNHKYPYVKADLEKYGNISKVICGDDYKPIGKSGSYKPQMGVVEAVDEYCKNNDRIFWTDPESFFWTALKK